MQKLSRFFTVFLFAIFCLGISSIAEEITLTTYYPAPYGNYVELQASKLAIGSGTTMPSNDGEGRALKLAVGSGASMPATDGDLVAAGAIQANTAFNINGTPGYAGPITITFVTDVQGPPVQKKTRTITINGGIITDVGAESGWL